MCRFLACSLVRSPLRVASPGSQYGRIRSKIRAQIRSNTGPVWVHMRPNLCSLATKLVYNKLGSNMSEGAPWQPILGESVAQQTSTQLLEIASEVVPNHFCRRTTIGEVFCVDGIAAAIQSGTHASHFLFLKGVWGCRKTTSTVELVRRQVIVQSGNAPLPTFPRDDLRVMAITYRRVLTRKLQKDFVEAGLTFAHYKDAHAFSHDRVATTLDSIVRVPSGATYDIIILDEVSSVLFRLSTTDMKGNKRSVVASRLIELCRTARLVIGLDKNIGARELQFAADILAEPAQSSSLCHACGQAVPTARY
jgi:hypothetical protein